MKASDKAYRIIAISCLLILIAVQFKLIYNTFELKNNQYYLKEKQILHDEYATAIRNDKIYPGAQYTIDAIIYANFDTLRKSYYAQSFGEFNRLKEQIWEQMLPELQHNSNMDSLMQDIIKRKHLDPRLRYVLYVQQLSVTFDGVNYLPIFGLNSTSQANRAYISGTLKNADKQNQVAAYTVNSGLENSYQISFSLHVDRDSRLMLIIKDMLPTFMLSFLSISLVIGIYYITYRNWMRQKKLTAMTSDFLNSVTHEFNTPVATILVANHSLAHTSIPNNPLKVKEFTAVIERQAQRLKKLIQQSLMISKLSNMNLDTSPEDISSVLMESLADYSLKLSADMAIIPEIEEDIPEIYLNKFLFTTMLYNILDNAFKYNDAPYKKVWITLRRREDLLSLEIQDNGIGMSADTVKYMYKKFYRGKDKIQEEGLGLGMFYVQQVIKLHDWSLDVHSQKGRGTTFHIKIK